MAGEIDEIKMRLSAEAVIGRSVSLQRSGQNLRGRCPFHEERTPSFFVFPDSGNYKCFGCGEAGDIFTFVMKTENLDFRQALVQLANESGVNVRTQQRDPAQVAHLKALLEVVESACSYFESQLANLPEGASARAYLEERGITPELQRRFRLGLAPSGWDSLLSHLRQRGAGDDLMLAAGVIRTGDRGSHYDAFRGRLMFPIRSIKGRVAGFGGRTLADDPAKYVNTATTAVFDKGNLLYGLDLALPELRRTRRAIIVEGYTDVISAHQAGIENVVASMGTSLTERQFRSIASQVDQIVLCMDGDVAGQAAGRRNLERMEADLGRLTWHEGRLDAEIRIATLPAGSDPDDLIRADISRFGAIIDGSQPLAEHLFDAIVAQAGVDTRQGRAKAFSQAIPYLRRVAGGDPVARADYVAALAKRLEIAPQVIEDQLRRGARSGTSLGEQGAPAARGDRAAITIDDRLCALGMRNPALLRHAIGRDGLPVAAFDSGRARTVFELLSRLQSSESAVDYLAAHLGADMAPYLAELAAVNSRLPAEISESQLLADLGRLVLELRRRRIEAEAERARSLLSSDTDGDVRKQALDELAGLVRERSLIDRQLSTLSIST